ncbi:Enoyl-CoA-hydratase [compost metagenome]
MIAGLAARIPHKIAMEVMLLGRTIDAQRAHDAGLVNDVVPVGRQVEAAMAMADELSRSAPLVLKALKRFVAQSVMPKGPSERMADALRELNVVRDSDDTQEGMRAFREKRAASYNGR